MFCRHGIPVTIKTDNGPQFIAAEYEQYYSENGIEHFIDILICSNYLERGRCYVHV